MKLLFAILCYSKYIYQAVVNTSEDISDIIAENNNLKSLQDYFKLDLQEKTWSRVGSCFKSKNFIKSENQKNVTKYKEQLQTDDILYKIMTVIFNIFSQCEKTRCFFDINKSKGDFLYQINMLCVKEQRILDGETLELDQIINNYFYEVKQKCKLTLSMDSFILCFAKISNIFNSYFNRAYFTKYIYLDKYYSYSQFFIPEYKIITIFKNKQPLQTFDVYGYSNMLEFCFNKKGLVMKLSEEHYQKNCNISEIDCFYIKILNYPEVLFINSQQNFGFFVKNYLDQTFSFKKIQFYDAIYEIFGFIRINVKENNYDFLAAELVFKNLSEQICSKEKKSCKKLLNNNERLIIVLQFVKMKK